MNPSEHLARSLARAFEETGSTSKTVLRKVLQDHIRRLAALRATADDADIESFYTICAWYLTKAYMLEQECVIRQEFAAEDFRIIEDSRRIKAVSALSEAWGPKAIDALRTSLHDPLPLPTIPTRDFLEALVKIATKLALKQFLQHFPDFVRDRLHTWRTEDQFHQQELQPCLQFRHINTYYTDWYAPRILQQGTMEHSSKRLKPNSSQRRTRSSTRTSTYSRDDDVERPRQTSLPALVEEDSLVGETSPAPIQSPDSSPQQSQLYMRSRNASTAGIIEPELDTDISFVDEELYQVGGEDISPKTGVSDHADSSSNGTTMARRRAPSLGRIYSAKLVQGKLEDLQENGGMKHALEVIRWSITAAKELEQLTAQKAVAKEALTAVERNLEELDKLIEESAPAGKTLDEAISELDADIETLQTLIDRMTAIQKEVDGQIVPGLAAFGVEDTSSADVLESKLRSAEMVKSARACKLAELEELQKQLEEQEEVHEKRRDESEAVSQQHAQLMAMIREIKEFVDLVSSKTAAMAKLTLPPPTLDAGEDE